MSNFYNTINLYGSDLFRANDKARKQEDVVLELFKSSKGLTPFEVDEKLRQMGRIYPITSIRRSITNLTKEGKLVKTAIKRVGDYGQMNYVWEIKS